MRLCNSVQWSAVLYVLYSTTLYCTVHTTMCILRCAYFDVCTTMWVLHYTTHTAARTHVPLKVTLSRARGVLSKAWKSVEGKVRLPNLSVSRPNGNPLFDSPMPANWEDEMVKYECHKIWDWHWKWKMIDTCKAEWQLEGDLLNIKRRWDITLDHSYHTHM